MKIIFFASVVILMTITILQGRPESVAQNHEISPSAKATTVDLDKWLKEPSKGDRGFF